MPVKKKKLVSAKQLLFTRDEAAEYTRLGVRTIDRLMDSGALPFARPSPRRTLIHRADLDALLKPSRKGEEGDN